MRRIVGACNGIFNFWTKKNFFSLSAAFSAQSIQKREMPSCLGGGCYKGLFWIAKRRSGGKVFWTFYTRSHWKSLTFVQPRPGGEEEGEARGGGCEETAIVLERRDSIIREKLLSNMLKFPPRKVIICVLFFVEFHTCLPEASATEKAVSLGLRRKAEEDTSLSILLSKCVS